MKLDDWYSKANLEQLTVWGIEGLGIMQMCKLIGVSPCAFSKWRKKKPLIDKYLNAAMSMADLEVQNALYRSALGYNTVETEVTFRVNKEGKMSQTKVIETHKEIAPSVQACQVWLYNRLPKDWKRNRDKSFEFDEQDNHIEIKISRQEDREEE
jgi:hypothetical protein